MMRRLAISIEIDGLQTAAGTITGSSGTDAVFTYEQNWLEYGVPLSLSLPLQKEPFSPAGTRNFFEGLLPEGFMRRSVAKWLQKDEEDYLSILSALGNECLGAIRVREDEFPTVKADYLPLSPEQVRALAAEGAGETSRLVVRSHLSLTGASGKAGLYYDPMEKTWFLPVGDAPSTHIVKQSHVRLRDIVVNEQLCQLTARKLGIEVPNSFVADSGSKSEDCILFATERYDRIMTLKGSSIAGHPVPFRLHQEDMGQALGIPAFQKYEPSGKHYLQDMFSLLRSHAADPMADQLRLWDMIVFDYLIGNTDNHIKNYSLLYSANLKSMKLAPAYDMLSTVVYPESTRHMAFRINGKDDVSLIQRADFGAAAKEAGIGRKMALDHFDILAGRLESALTDAAGELYDQGFRRAGEFSRQIMGKGGMANL